MQATNLESSPNQQSSTSTITEKDDVKIDLDSIYVGVKFSYFTQFIQEHGGRDNFINMETREVCSKYIIPQCKETSLSVCNTMKASPNPEISSIVGQPTWFISHTWGYLFLDVVDAVKSSLKRLYGDSQANETVVWFDLFSLHQDNARTSLPFSYLSEVFLGLIGGIKNLMMVTLPWNNPVILTRAWCVFEVYSCHKVNGVFEVALTDKESVEFFKRLNSDSKAFRSVLQNIETRNCQSFYESDKNQIESIIRENVEKGFITLDRIVANVILRWTLNELKKKGYTASYMRSIGFSGLDLADVGFTIDDLIDMGFCPFLDGLRNIFELSIIKQKFFMK